MQISVSKSNTLNSTNKKLLLALFFTISITSICEWLVFYLEFSGFKYIFLQKIAKVIELSLAPAIPFLFGFIVDRRRYKFIFIFLVFHCLLEIISAFTGFIFNVDINGVYSHGTFYSLYIATYIVAIFYVSVIVLNSIKKYQYSGFSFFLGIMIFTLIGIFVQLFNAEIRTVYICVGITAIMLYVFCLEMIQQTDELTELLNRRGYENYIAHNEEKCIVVFFDIDNFKYVNDTHGHSFGDYSLKILGKLIKEKYSSYGKCFRYGGDEFCVIMNSQLDDIDKINSSFFSSIASIRESEERLPTVSIGYAYFDPSNQNIEDVVKEADKMMYIFKSTRKKQSSE